MGVMHPDLFSKGVCSKPLRMTSVWPKTPLHRIQFISHVPRSQVYLFSVIVFISAVALGRARTSAKDQQPASHVFLRRSGDKMVPLSL